MLRPALVAALLLAAGASAALVALPADPLAHPALRALVAEVLAADLALSAGPAPAAETRAWAAGILGLLGPALPVLEGLRAAGVQGCHGVPGRVLLCGVGDDLWDRDARVSIDLGGDDTYLASVGGTGLGASLHVDLDGDDAYLAPAFTMGSTTGGVGLALELAGNDRYESEYFSQGHADFEGVGLLFDAAGDDAYRAYAWSQGAAPAWWLTGDQGFPLAALVDHDGNDTYHCFGGCQASSYQEAAEVLLLDRAGDDRYSCVEELCQGWVPYTPFSAGALVDGAGDDTYACGKPRCYGYVVDAKPLPETVCEAYQVLRAVLPALVPPGCPVA